MVIKGLEVMGYPNLAQEIAIRHLDTVVRVFRETGTFWENYAADSYAPGINTNGAPVVKDMVGLGALASNLYLLESATGLKTRCSAKPIIWKITSQIPCGCERFRFNGLVVDLIARPSSGNTTLITIQSDGEFYFTVFKQGIVKACSVAKGMSEWIV